MAATARNCYGADGLLMAKRKQPAFGGLPLTLQTPPAAVLSPILGWLPYRQPPLVRELPLPLPKAAAA